MFGLCRIRLLQQPLPRPHFRFIMSSKNTSPQRPRLAKRAKRDDTLIADATANGAEPEAITGTFLLHRNADPDAVAETGKGAEMDEALPSTSKQAAKTKGARAKKAVAEPVLSDYPKRVQSAFKASLGNEEHLNRLMS